MAVRIAHDTIAPKASAQQFGGAAGTAMTASTALTVPAGANALMWQALTQPVRWRDDGGTPTATVGMQLVAGLAPEWYYGDLSAIRIIETHTDAELNVFYYEVH